MMHQGVKTVVDQGESILPLKVLAQIVRMNPLSYPQGNQITIRGDSVAMYTICVQDEFLFRYNIAVLYNFSSEWLVWFFTG